MFTLADLTRLSGVKRRTVQLWAEAGALMAEPPTERQGSGTHRVFSRDEAIVCLILSRFAHWGLPIGKLIWVAGIVRNRVLKDKERRELIDRTIQGEAMLLRLTLSESYDVGLFHGPGETRLRLGPDNEGSIVVWLDNALSALSAEPKD
jgi:hypothetical protein